MRIIYLLVILALSYPLMTGYVLRPAKMRSAEDLYQVIENLPRSADKMVLVAFDWGPSTAAENRPQTTTVIEHLMRLRIPFAVITTYPYGAPFLDDVPNGVAARLQQEKPGEKWEYGVDWVNLGYQPGGAIMIQGLARAADLSAVIKTDARGTPLREIPCMKEVVNLKNISLLAQITGLVGVFSNWIQFFQQDDYKPEVVHGCTSITIPEAYIYYVSGQIKGLYEGVAGAAWYDYLLSERYPLRQTTDAGRVNTSLASAHLLILGLILVGNVITFVKRKR
jgi:hypothetical protein